MKVGIITLYGSSNYGNRLQNYAVCKVLRLCGLNETNIIIEPKTNIFFLLMKVLLPIKIIDFIKEIKGKSQKSLLITRIRNFQKFTFKHMRNKKICLSINHLNRLYFKSLDKIFVGSDQVWNPDFAGQDYYFLNFVEPYQRIAFAASIGYTELPEDVLKRYTEHWKQMRYISVREDSAADIIEQATGKRPDVFLDPTLLLTKDEWNEVAKQPKVSIPEKYILCLFLGKTPEYIKQVYQKVYDMELVILNDKSYPNYYVQGPSEFIWLVQNAELVLTDSFHCSVFSIIYHKQFWVFEREDEKLKNMFTRMETLLKRFDMMDRVQKWDNPVSFERIVKERFIEAEDIRERERNRVLQIIGDIINESA